MAVTVMPEDVTPWSLHTGTLCWLAGQSGSTAWVSECLFLRLTHSRSVTMNSSGLVGSPDRRASTRAASYGRLTRASASSNGVWATAAAADSQHCFLSGSGCATESTAGRCSRIGFMVLVARTRVDVCSFVCLVMKRNNKTECPFCLFAATPSAPRQKKIPVRSQMTSVGIVDR